MKNYFVLFCTLFICCMTFLGAAEGSSRSIAWSTNYQDALTQSKSTGKPIVLFFTGSDWCGWCNKLEREVLNTSEFASLAGDKYIFVMLDFPLYKPQDPKLASSNKQLQEKYNVQGYPTLIIINSDQKKIGLTGYRQGGPKLFADHLRQLVEDSSSK